MRCINSRFFSSKASLAVVLALALGQGLALWRAPALAHGDKIHGDEPAGEPVVLAPGYESLQYDAPVPGTYKLPNLGKAGDGDVLDTAATERSLHGVLDKRITVLSFIYRACNDVNGCPLATYVLHQVRQSLEDDPAIADQVQLVSMSFDPEYDTPESMADYAASFGKGKVDWQFLTSANQQAVDKVLAAYGQSISKIKTGEQEETRSINHILRVYVIDGDKTIRNIYNSSLLHADSLVSDIKTLLLEASGVQTAGVVASPEPVSTLKSQAVPGVTGDDRSGYASGAYVSRSRALARNAESRDLLALAEQQSLGLPPLPHLSELSPEKVALGRRLFFDRRLSINNTFSCAMCHLPEQGFAANELSTAVGVEGRTVRRNAPSLLNVGYLQRLFHDSREYSLEQQAWSPLLAHNEMANPSIGYVLSKIAGLPDYQDEFFEAFNQRAPSMQNLGEALAAYQRVLVAGNSPFDRWHFAGEETAVSEQVKQGFKLFTGKAGCAGCHTMEEGFALFTDEKLHNTGIGYRRSMRKRNEPHPVTLAPGVVVMVDPKTYAAAAEEPPGDLGLYEITLNPADRWMFRTPGLRNVQLSPPYMHDGSISSLAEVLEFYNQGGIANPLLAAQLKPLGLSAGELASLQAFLHSLTSDAVPALVQDALAAPVGDVHSADPGL